MGRISHGGVKIETGVPSITFPKDGHKRGKDHLRALLPHTIALDRVWRTINSPEVNGSVKG